MSSDLSVIIPAFNEQNYIQATLEALIESASRLEADGVSTQIIVVDDGSTDDTSVVAARAADKVLVGPRLGIGFARNFGASVATSPLLVFLDADTVVEPGVLPAIYQAWSAGSLLGAVIPFYYSGKPSIRILLALWRWYAPRRGVVQGVCQFVHRDFFDILGGYRIDYFMGEDSEFFRRAKRALGPQQAKQVALLQEVAVFPSMRRYAKWSPIQAWFWTNPLTTSMFRRSRGFWKGWYIDPPR